MVKLERPLCLASPDPVQVAAIVLIAFSILALAGVIYQVAGRRNDRRAYPPPGRLFDVDGTSFHLLEMGASGPSVVFEAGMAASSLGWGLVQPAVSRFARTASYDRAGLGWSGPARQPRELNQSVGELHALLRTAGIEAPYVLVGHSYGGLLVRAFAAAYPEEVAGLVLVDPVAVEEWAQPSDQSRRRLRRAVRLSRRGAWLANLGVVRFALAQLLSGGNRLPTFIGKLTSGGNESVASRLVGEVSKLPPESWPMVRAHWCNPKCFRSMAAHLEQLPASAGALAGLGPLPDVPVCVISAGSSTAAERAERQALVNGVSCGEHILAEGTGHWIQLDRPEVVVDACRRMLDR
jgi:pimeloyl-ACP methyl ester carboxylesterase